MKIVIPILITLFSCIRLPAHDLSDAGDGHPHTPGEPSGATPPQAAPFSMFAPAVKTRWDENFLFIESNGLPAHNMMVGITAWQQQVPLPQDYTGANAWRVPLKPVPAKQPRSIRGEFLRGAIAIAANGVPIFNPQNNRGEISLDIGELDEWGGHCGRADDYHYHVAPLHLQKVTGPELPIAYALDGYPVYGLTEPDGSEPEGLDAFNGHSTPGLGYHYHASKKYPFVMGGFHGEVVERDGQVDPQPRASGVREALPALRGAKITGFESTGANRYKLSYEVNGDKRAVLYAVNPDGTFPFEFQNGSAGTTKEVYTLRQRGGGRPPRSEAERPPRREGGGDGQGKPRGGQRTDEDRHQESVSRFGPDAMKKPDAAFVLTSTAVKDGGALPIDFTGDGSGDSPPLSWRGAPADTKGYALLMDHLTPDKVIKHYWTMWDIPASVTSLPENVQGIGKVGTGFKGRIGYEPPHSQGPGAKTYGITIYALSSPLAIAQPPREVDRDVLLAAMQDKVLASASLNVVYARGGSGPAQAKPKPASSPPPQTAGEDRPPPQRRPGGGKGGPPGLVKPTIADTTKLNVYADNWFMLYVNGRLVAVDPIQFTPHNVVSVDFLPEYPMTSPCSPRTTRTRIRAWNTAPASATEGSS